MSVEENKKTAIYERYENSRSYLDVIGLTTNIPKFVRYYEGDQWPPATERTKSLPRPVVNICKYVTRNKKAGILSTPVKIMFNAEDGSDTKIINKWHEYIEKELRMREVDARAIEDGGKKGTYVYHYFWDKSKQGYDGTITGGVNVEVIEPLNLRVSNPLEDDEQKQKWIIIVSREEVGAVRLIAKAEKVDPDLIQPDQSDSTYMEEEQEGTDYVTVLTQYTKRNGQVYFEKSTKDVIFQKERPLTPDIKEALKKVSNTEEDEADSGLQNAETEDKNDPYMFDIYPIVVGNWEYRDKSLYGISEVETLIENQDIINRNIAYQIKARRDMSLGGWLVKENALKDGDTISNAPNQIIRDRTPGNDFGIKPIPVNNIPQDGMALVDALINMIRTTTGATEVMSGEVIGANMSGAAISALQSQAQLPLEELRQRFWRVKEKQAQVLMRYYRLFYDKRDFNGYEQDASGKKINKSYTFDPELLVGKRIDVVAQAGAGSSFSEITRLQVLENLASSGQITLKQFITLAGDKLLGDKEELLNEIELQEQSQIVVLSQENEKLKVQITQAAEVLSEQNKAIEQASQLVHNNRNLNKTILELESFIQNITNQLRETQEDATMFAQELLKNKGVEKNGSSDSRQGVRKDKPK